MRRFRKWISDVAGVTRREKRATFVVAVILVVLIIIRYTSVSSDRVTIVITPLDVMPAGAPAGTEKEAGPVYFAFDPNSVTREDLIRLGLSEKTASTMINYRKAGARFYRPADMLKVYGVDSQLVVRLSPYMMFGQAPGEDAIAEEKRGSTISSLPGVEEKPAVMIELNTCTAAELESLPGIGEVLSERIIRFRDLLGGFVNMQQLSEVYGIDTACLDRIYQMVFVNPDPVRHIVIDSCSFRDLARHPYIGAEAARAILRYRDLIGSPPDAGELVRQHVIDSATAHRMKPYCIFGGTVETGAGTK